jgi:hypothetical protein
MTKNRVAADEELPLRAITGKSRARKVCASAGPVHHAAVHDPVHSSHQP